MKWLFDLSDLFHDILIRGADLVIDLDELPSDDALSVDDIGRGMRDRPARIDIEQTVTVDHLVVRIREQRELIPLLLADLVDQDLRFVVRIDADRQDFDLALVFLIEERFQLT